MNTRNGYAKCIDCGDVRFMKRLRSDGTRLCRSCAAKRTNARTNSASKGGKIGGKRTTELGKLRLAGMHAHTLSAEAKRFETLKRTGKLFSSVPEKLLKDQLWQRFGEHDVEHHVIVDGYRIDFYVKSINTYIQLDGTYWHGLDVPYDQLTGTPKEKFDRDRRCDAHFDAIGLRLVRITDKKVREGTDALSQL
jgi:very-short-patch-repair endonuclease